MRDVDEAQVAAILDVIYDAAVCPNVSAWVCVLEQLGRLFDSHFVDLFARTDDWSAVQGRAVGMEQAEYEGQFLGVWCDRNVWSRARPVRVAGEVMPTWQMVARRDLERSAIYNEFLHIRGLDEGMRLALWAGDGWILDISLLRSGSVGAFDGGAIALGKLLLPHLQRAAATARRMRGQIGFAGLQGADRAAFLLDPSGRVVEMNAAAAGLLATGEVFAVRDGRLTTAADRQAAELAGAVAAAARLGLCESRRLTLMGTAPANALVLDVVPVREQSGWAMPGPRSVLVAAACPGAPPHLTEWLADQFGLTRAEVDLTRSLAAGQSLSEIAVGSGRSINTVRTHLARAMAKTRTRRQSQLVSLLLDTASRPVALARRPG